MGEFPNKDTQFKPGESGNLKGRPVVNDIKRFIKERLAEETATGSNITKLEAIIAKLLHKAGQGDHKAMELCIKYGYGNPTQIIEMTGKDGQQLITHDFSKFSNDQLTERITQIEGLIRSTDAAGPAEGGGPEA